MRPLSMFRKWKKHFGATPRALKVVPMVAKKQNRIVDILLFLGGFVWLIWIFFDYWFAPNVCLFILPVRIVAATIFFLAYSFKHKLTFEQKQDIIMLTVNAALAYMFSIIPKPSFPTYFTGFTFTTAVTYQTFHMSRKRNLLYSLSAAGVFLTAYVFNKYTFLDLLGGGGFATFSILLLMIFIAENNRQNDIEFFENALLIEKQKQDIEHKNKSITQSINYAKRIQMSLLPNEESIRKHFQDAFVLYKPRDIVSGDFYWFAEHREKIIVAVADCTGHGVPGAFMSLINNNFLNQVIKEQQVLEPSKVLTFVREKVILTLSSYQTDSHIKDGMDICLLSIDKKNFSVEFAGANRPLWLLRSGTIGQVEEIDGDKFFIGYSYNWQSKNFQNQKLYLSKGDRLYLFTDGVTDQFGGEDDKKFGKNRLKQLLVETACQPLKVQKIVIDEALQKWQGLKSQTDDVCIVGIQL